MLAQVFFVFCPGSFYIPESRNVSEALPHGPALLTQSKWNYSKGIVANPSSSPQVLFVPATGLFGGGGTGRHPLSNNRRHLVAISSLSHQTA